MTGTTANLADARDMLARFGFDAARSNDRSAMVLLTLLGLRPGDTWSEATGGRHGVYPLMQKAQAWGAAWEWGTRETVRRQTLHQFVEAGFVEYNSDEPDRPVNTLSPGGQNVLLKAMVEEFSPRFTPGGHVLYIGDADGGAPVYDVDTLASLGVTLDHHGKLPDLVVHLPDRGWLVLAEAASSHGPVDAKRHTELQHLFRESTAGLVFVSAFSDRANMRTYLTELAWETDAWCASDPDHMVHFNGERFLGPYD